MGANIRYAYAERKRNLHGTPAVKPYIKHRMPDLQRQALALVPVNRRAVRASINRTLQLGREAVYAQMRQVFRAPVPYTLNAVRVEQARTEAEGARLRHSGRRLVHGLLVRPARSLASAAQGQPLSLSRG